MPRFTTDPREARVTARIFDKGDYELKVRNVSPFVRTKRDDPDKTSAGVLVFTEMCGAVDSTGELTEENVGESLQPIRCYVHTPGAFRMSKRFLIAAKGFPGTPDGEDEFDEEHADPELFMVDGEADEDDTWECGQGWKDLVGCRIRAALDKGMFEGNEQQDFRSFLPIS